MRRLGRFLRACLRLCLYLLLILVIFAAVPITYTELSCKSPVAPSASDKPDHLPATLWDGGFRRAEGDSYLTYPEWYIVHAYADLAGVTRQASESAFDYHASVTGFWSSLCSATKMASAIGPVTLDQRITNYIIGLSFSLEMGVQGLYERTIGALTVRARGDTRTPEDAFNLRFLDDYAAFLQQTPWYAYPFKTELTRFWQETPWSGQAPIRAGERRFALSLEYGAKWGYGAAMRLLAGLSPADLRLRSVIRRTSENEAWPEGVTQVRDLGDHTFLVETPRYQAFTDILRSLAKRGDTIVEIAGNSHILTTIVAPADAALKTPGAREIFSIPFQSRPGWRRIGLDTDVSGLTTLIDTVERQGATFEHAYDY
jgi:hypothetical protein